VANVHFTIRVGAAVNLWMVSVCSEDRCRSKEFKEGETNLSSLVEEKFGMIWCGREDHVWL
jgi:hypothetical protein